MQERPVFRSEMQSHAGTPAYPCGGMYGFFRAQNGAKKPSMDRPARDRRKKMKENDLAFLNLTEI